MPQAMPYAWLNSILSLLALGTVVAALVLVVAAIVRGKRRRKRTLFGAGACFAGFLILAAANYALIFLVQLPSLGHEAQRDRQARVEAVSLDKIGDPAPSFRIRTVNGAEFAIDELRGKVVLLNFFATWCGPCLQELPHIQELWRQYGSRADFALLVIGREESDESVRAFMEKHGYTFPVAADPERSVYSRFAEELIPRTYLVARDGKIHYATTGFNEGELQRLKAELAKQLRSTE